jgi:hypothetical protein
MHPKRPEDLEISLSEWIPLRAGIVWMIAQLFDFWPILIAKFPGSGVAAPQDDRG